MSELLFCLTKQQFGQKNSERTVFRDPGLYSVSSFDMMRPA